ncbi:DUF2244 domain-containing protein [Ancylobacter sp. 6x-1]|uniref:DUF2244 domain-containing protein n=1 Tax=Ancylobacter crimeensis TaxID=2579147 RepID=A0ABT0DAR4_9HYPH|nr:DUF2244 domain-containing protein [Ancylobacter crimeensis]MCK0197050.1 DUF2244 domain-containing protein [Ancylobacter crimeensis]
MQPSISAEDPADLVPEDADATGLEPTLYEATLIPYRSLDERGFLIVMLVIAGVSFACGLAFMLMGAWPVMGLFGLDVLLMWIALRMNFHAARAREEITVTPSRLTVRKVSPNGFAVDTEMNPLWTRLQTEVHEEFGMQKLTLISRGTPTEIGGFLHASERKEIAAGLSTALAVAKRGIDRSLT